MRKEMKFQNEKFQFTVERQVDGTYRILTKRLVPKKLFGFIIAPAGEVGQLIISEYDTQLESLHGHEKFSIKEILALLAKENAKPVDEDGLTPEEIKNKLENLNVKKFSEINDY